MQGPSGITRLLRAWGGGDEAALEQLTPLVYDQLRRPASRHMGREHPGYALR
jgi:RNA polymerase sigma-70 factor (ECF subfamily)